MKTIIYSATNTINGKRYIGLTSRNLKVRIAQHYEATSPCIALRRALSKYDKEVFIWEVIYECKESDSPLEREEFYIKHFNTLAPYGYNLMSESNGVRTVSDETRIKMSEAQRGRSFSEETRRKMSESAKKVPNEIRRLNALGNTNRRGKKCSDESRTRMSVAHLGKKHTEEHKRKISEATKGKLKGRVFSEETKKRMSIARKKYLQKLIDNVK